MKYPEILVQVASEEEPKAVAAFIGIAAGFKDVAVGEGEAGAGTNWAEQAAILFKAPAAQPGEHLGKAPARRFEPKLRGLESEFSFNAFEVPKFCFDRCCFGESGLGGRSSEGKDAQGDAERESGSFQPGGGIAVNPCTSAITGRLRERGAAAADQQGDDESGGGA